MLESFGCRLRHEEPPLAGAIINAELTRHDGCVTDPEEPDRSEIEQIYDRNVAEEALKHGTTYERLTAFIFQTLDAAATVQHDVRLRGDGKKTKNQIDVHITRGGQSSRVIIECRDKTDPNKIGVNEARAFATVVRHMDARGIMVTTTDYTEGARDLADDEGVQLLTLRPFQDTDAEGRLIAIEVNIRVANPVPDSIVVKPVDESLDGQQLPVNLAAPITGGNDNHATLRDLIWSMMDAPLEGEVPSGSRISELTLDPPVTVDNDGQMVDIAAIQVHYHVEVSETRSRVDAGARIAELVVRTLDGSFDRVIWNEDLKRFELAPKTKIVRPRHSDRPSE